MRALGPGSVASLLKIALDCAYVVLWIGAVALAVALVGILLALPFLSGFNNTSIHIDGHAAQLGDLVRRWPALEAVLLSAGLYTGALIVIFNRLRRVFETLTLGDPFRPENVGRLRIVGLSLIALEVLGDLVRMAGLWLVPDPDTHFSLNISLTGWFAILAVFVLAEVFREGARLRSDAELTI